MIFVYFTFSVSFLVLATWVMIRVINNTKYPPNNDDEGGTTGGLDFPIIDLPPGGQVEDLLVDRWPEDAPKRSFDKVR